MHSGFLVSFPWYFAYITLVWMADSFPSYCDKYAAMLHC